MESNIDDVIAALDDSLCATCFGAIESTLNVGHLTASLTALQGTKHQTTKLLKSLMDRQVSCPLFVTWMKLDPNGEEELRGCIGTLSPVPISQLGTDKAFVIWISTGYYAKSSAFDDIRFEPISAGELPLLVCKVSLLHSYENAKDPLDWEIGKHGIIVEFVKDRKYSATYLPEVALEHNMTKETAIKELVKKAGYRRPINSDLWASIKAAVDVRASKILLLLRLGALTKIELDSDSSKSSSWSIPMTISCLLSLVSVVDTVHGDRTDGRSLSILVPLLSFLKLLDLNISISEVSLLSAV
ncbi:DUF51 family protein, putative [Babesia ovis]|uniref:DUF51 family protein, putative n=1 Tax=Babesia ovis TaxID=5869 RepID=A0A9W5WV70_BABOV|nr:DUF51 family protein, putative [Babesia ovis]